MLRWITVGVDQHVVQAKYECFLSFVLLSLLAENHLILLYLVVNDFFFHLLY